MKNENKPSHPVKLNNMGFMGLSKREYFAGLALQGLLANSGLEAHLADKYAVEWADALLAELEIERND